jgi:Protein of unknown function (DUF1501)
MISREPLTRRRFHLASAAAGLGSLLRLEAQFASPRSATADACILLFLNGGMSHLDTFDPKPDQPPEIRGEFRAVRTSPPASSSPNTCPTSPGRRTASPSSAASASRAVSATTARPVITCSPAASRRARPPSSRRPCRPINRHWEAPPPASGPSSAASRPSS